MKEEQLKRMMRDIYGREDITPEAVEEFEEMLSELSEREEAVLSLRYGLKDGKEMSEQEVADYYEVSLETIQKTMKQARLRLRHPLRTRRLFLQNMA